MLTISVMRGRLCGTVGNLTKSAIFPSLLSSETKLTPNPITLSFPTEKLP